MKLVLVRHGKAEKSVDGMEDAGRCLTAVGINELEKSMPSLKTLVGDSKSIRLWSSPLLRATQSARIIADYFMIKEPAIYDFISSGNFVSFANELVKMNPDSTAASEPVPDCLIIVGHQPWLSDWCRVICGVVVPFKKGDAVSIVLHSLSPLTGMIDKLAISKIAKFLLYYLQEIKNTQIIFLEQPEGIENPHQLRVNIRKFRSLLSFFRPLLIHEDYLKYQEKMRKAGQLFSYLRELDILQSEWSKLVSTQIIKLKNPDELSIILQNERDMEKTKLLKQLADGVLTATIFEIELWLSDLNNVDDLKSEKAFAVYTNQMTKKWEGKIRKELMTIENLDLRRIHLLRINCKKLRYIQEILLEKYSNKRDNRKSFKMMDLQDSLGYLCDTQRNIEIIERQFSTNESFDTSYEKNLFISYLVGKQTGLNLLFNSIKGV